MSKVTTICCTRCGRELYESQSHPKENKVRHVEFYEVIGNDFLAEHYCSGCYRNIYSNDEKKDKRSEG